ncbi:glycine-rich domain-containing protein [Enterocloster lavalensis]|uniref:glycine-rich domain-containing protein n=1 Tax=Enterocloster lavalensis TaxID=460384 RepID=UPI003AB96933
MGKMIINCGGGGINLEEVTGTTSDLIKGKSAYLQGSDDPQTGTLELTGNATAAYVYSGKTFYSTDPKSKLTGTMTVSSILSFSAAVYSSTAITFSWKNPAKGLFSGVIIRGKTGSYPASITDGTQYYKGAGNNTTANGTSSATVSSFAAGTKYYFAVFSYCTCSAGELQSGRLFTAVATTSTVIMKTFTASGSYTVPAGYRKIDIFCVGGGGGGGGSPYCGGAGAGGKTKTVTGMAVAPGTTYTLTVGAGGAGAKRLGTSNKSGETGGTSSFGALCAAAGGAGGNGTIGGNGGSGGGGSGGSHSSAQGGSGGTNGGAGNGGYNAKGGAGQGTTTRAWSSASGTLYSGGGGGGGTSRSNFPGGRGGAGGGGDGGSGNDSAGSPAAANTGGGGGGGAYHEGDSDYKCEAGGNGGSGIVLIKLY